MTVGTALVLTDGTTSCDLTAGTAYIIKRGTLKIRREGDKVIAGMVLGVIGADLTTALTNYRNLASVKRTAALWRDNGWGRKVTLTLTYNGGTANTFDVLEVQIPELARRWGSEPVLDDLPLTIICRPSPRGAEAQLVAATTLDNHDDADSGDDMMASIAAASIAGDRPAECRVWLENNDANALTYGTVRLGCFADYRASAVTPAPVVEGENYIVANATSAVVVDSTCSNGYYYRLSPATGASLNCDGTYYASIADAAWQDLGSAFTLECAIYLDSDITIAPSALIAKWNDTGDQKSYILLVEGNASDEKVLRLIVSTDGSTKELDVRGATALTTGVWYWVHAEYAFDSATGVHSGWIYLDGAIDGQASTPAPPAATTTLDPNGAGTDNDWTVPGSTAWEELSDNDLNNPISSITAGQKTSVALGDITVTGTVTSVKVQVQMSSTATEGDEKAFVSLYLLHGGTRYYSSSLAISPFVQWHSATWAVDPSDGTAWTQADINALEAGVRYDAGGTSTALAFEMQVIITEIATTGIAPHAGTATLRIGDCDGWATADNITGSTAKAVFNGKIDEVRISTSRQSTSRSTPTEALSGGAALYHCDDGTGTSVTDSSGNSRTLTASNASIWSTVSYLAPLVTELRAVTYTAPESLAENYAGWYDVYARVRVNAGDITDVKWRLRWANGPWWTSYQNRGTVVNTWFMSHVGRVHLPWYAVQDSWIADDIMATATNRYFELWTEHAGATDYLELDYFLFLPLEPWSGYVRNCNMARYQGLMISTLDHQPWIGRTGTAYTATEAPQALDARITLPYLMPNVKHFILVSVDRADGTNAIADTIDLTVRYLPCYEWTWI